MWKASACLFEINQTFRRDLRGALKELDAPLAVGFGLAFGGVDRLFWADTPVLTPPARDEIG